jgi:hypothetical protein
MLKSKKKNNITTFYNSSNAETYLALAPQFEDDFFGALLDTHKWTKYTAGAAPPTQLITSVENGVCQLLMTNAVEAQISGLYFADICPFRLDRGPVMEARVRWTTLPAEVTKMTAVLGLCNATAGDIDAITDSVWFRWDGDTLGLVTCESDDTGHEQSKVTSAITSVINVWQIFRIDLTDMQSAKFYINGTQVAKTTTFIVHTDIDQEYQPMIRLDKSADAGDLGVMEVDYVRVWETRD